MSKHALLAPSSAHRWLTCHPSARLNEGIDSGSEYAAEGTAAHALAEAVLSGDSKAQELARADEYYSEEMEREVAKFTEYIEEVLRVTQSRIAAFERKVPIDFIERGASGTVDALAIDYRDKILHVVDLKYGKGIEVSAYWNPQLLLYAWGAITQLDSEGLFGYETIRLHIAQPRLDNWDTFDITRGDLHNWIREVVQPAARLARDGKGELVTGEHCVFCKVKGRCRQWAEDSKKAASRPEELSEVLELLPRLKEWIKAIEEESYALLLNGEELQGYKLVESRGRRKISDPSALERELLKRGVPREKMFTEPELLGITAFESLLGKKVFSELPAGIVEYVPGKPAIVPSSDPRPAFNDCKFSSE